MLVIEAVCGLEESGTGRENGGTASKKVCLFGAGRGNGWMVGRCNVVAWCGKWRFTGIVISNCGQSTCITIYKIINVLFLPNVPHHQPLPFVS